METLTRPPQTPVRPRSVADRPRRWPRRILIALLALAIIAAGVIAVWVTNVEPFATGSEGYGVNDPQLHATIRHIDAMGVTGTVQTVRMHPEMTFRYRFSIRNDGPLPVTILDAGRGTDGDMVQSHLVAARPDLSPPPGPSDGFEKFAPFAIPAGGQAALAMEVRVSDHPCYAPRTVTSWYTEPVTFSIYGITRHTDVPTGTEIRLEGNRSTKC